MALKTRRKSSSNPVDVYVGSRMAERRTHLGLSQSALAKEVGVSFQAIQKYEAGEVRISASRLYDIAKSLDTPTSYFFDGYPDGVTGKSQSSSGKDDRRPAVPDELATVIRGYLAISDPELRADILRLISRLGHGT